MYLCAFIRPRSTLTAMRTGTASQIMATRKKNEYRMLPVVSAMTPTTRGPTKELDYPLP